jgi:hypothetical protein
MLTSYKKAPSEFGAFLFFGSYNDCNVPPNLLVTEHPIAVKRKNIR